MTIGNGLSTTGSFLGMGVDLLNSDYKNGTKDAFFVVLNLCLDSLLDKIIPGNDLGSKLIKKSSDVKLTMTENIANEIISTKDANENEKNKLK